MTLTEYLQNAVTELRRMAARRTDYALNWPDDAQRAQDLREFAKNYDALADHVEALLAEHVICDAPECEGAEEHCAACRVVAAPPGSAFYSCPSLRSVATLVATVTGTSLPEGAQ